jgi:hypothetical protein
MKDAEDEAFDELAKRQGDWGGGFQAKRQAAMDKINSEFREEYVKYRTAFSKGYTTQQVLPKDYTTQQPVPLVEIEYTLSIAEPAHCQCTACKDGILHASDCAVHNGPAYPAGPCDCGVAQEPDMQTGIAYQKGFHDGKQAALPAQQREWVGLTGEEIDELAEWHGLDLMVYVPFTEAIEAKLKEKNT